MADRVSIYRAPMRARELDLPPGVGAEHGIRRGVVGIRSGSGEKAARMLHRFATVPDGVFVWTRDSVGGYHSGRVSGPISEDCSQLPTYSSRPNFGAAAEGIARHRWGLRIAADFPKDRGRRRSDLVLGVS